MSEYCGKRFERKGRHPDICILPPGHYDACENVRGQTLPVQDPIPQNVRDLPHYQHMPPDDFDPNCAICTNGLRQEEMG